MRNIGGILCALLGMMAYGYCENLDKKQVKGLRIRITGVGFRTWGLGLRVRGVGFRTKGFGFRVQGVGFIINGFGLKGSGCRIKD